MPTLNELLGFRVPKTAPSFMVGGDWADPAALMGVEVEIEGQNINESQHSVLCQHWTQHVDTSLRNGTEYVTSLPVAGVSLAAAIDCFFDSGIRYVTSERTSVHVHINMTDNVELSAFRAFFALMYLIEPGVFRLADENRKWCGYCCPLTDMSVQRVLGILNGGREEFIAGLKGRRHQDKYYGFNTASLVKHGTMEFRYFPCTRDKADVLLWVNLVQECKRFGLSMGNVTNLCEAFTTRERIEALLEANMPITGPHILRHLDIEDVVFRAGELLQLLETDVDETTIYRSSSTRYGTAFRKLAKNKYSIELTTTPSKQAARLGPADALAKIREGDHVEAARIMRQYQYDLDLMGSFSPITLTS